MSETQAAAPQVSGAMLLYQRPELLSMEQHGGYGLSRTETPFAFCAKTRAVPVTVGEIVKASKHFPIIFTGAENPVPLAVLGMIDDINLFVDDKGAWDENAYLPAYIRRYPFAVANESGGERLAIVIDAAFEGVVPGGEIALFDNGVPTPSTEQAIEFCKKYETDRRTTEQAMKSLAKFDLISGQSAQYTPTDASGAQTFAQYFGIDEAKLRDMPDDKFLELRKSGVMPLIYAQLFSSQNWRELIARRARRHNLNDSNILSPLNLN